MRPCILSVDNHADTLALLEMLLGAYGYDVATAATVHDGVRRAKAGDFDLFLLDYRLADGMGRELCEKIREFDPRTPILFFSVSHPAIQREALGCGAQGFVLKPDFAGLRRECTSEAAPRRRRTRSAAKKPISSPSLRATGGSCHRGSVKWKPLLARSNLRGASKSLTRASRSRWTVRGWRSTRRARSDLLG